ncbi:MAG: hypothetical protein ACYC2Z_01580, partial [Candidatus Nanopelagicales bacterium]
MPPDFETALRPAARAEIPVAEESAADDSAADDSAADDSAAEDSGLAGGVERPGSGSIVGSSGSGLIVAV